MDDHIERSVAIRHVHLLKLSYAETRVVESNEAVRVGKALDNANENEKRMKYNEFGECVCVYVVL